ncbi:hypothetical protein SAMN05877809_11260 [Rhodobacter sp. JA431]|nr:hypothetical protein SAMN05877809_11260 [Rhodobacter sp. JA431]
MSKSRPRLDFPRILVNSTILTISGYLGFPAAIIISNPLKFLTSNDDLLLVLFLGAWLFSGLALYWALSSLFWFLWRLLKSWI